MLQQSISRNSLLLGGFALVTTLIIAVTFSGTKNKISENIRQAQQQALLQIIPKDRHSNNMLDNTRVINDTMLLGLREPQPLFIAKDKNSTIAVILPVTAREGYTGDINLLVGINIDGTVAGVRVISHRETPGLGDAIDHKKSDWIEQFSGKSLSNTAKQLWTVKKDGGEFDQFTGATITPRAVTKSVHQALIYFEKNRDAIIQQSIASQALTSNNE